MNQGIEDWMYVVYTLAALAVASLLLNGAARLRDWWRKRR